METPVAQSVTLSDPLSPEIIDPAESSTPPEVLSVLPFDSALAGRYSVANLGASLVYGLFNTALPLYLKSYGLSDWLVGLLANERSFVGAFVQPIVGRLSDKTRTPLGRRRPFFLIGVPLMAISLFLLAIHPPFWVMLGLMTVGSLFLAVAMDPYVAMMADLFPPQHRGRVGGLIGLTTALGIISFALAAFFLWEENEVLVFAITIVVLLLTFGFTFVTVKEPPVPPLKPALTSEGQPRTGVIAYIRGLLKYPEAAKYTLALTFFWMGSAGAGPFVTLFGTRALHATEGDVFLLPLAFVVASAVFSVPAGLLADKVGKKRVLTFGLLVYGLGAIAGSQSTDLAQATIALAIIGIGNAGTAPLTALLTDLIPRSRTAELVGFGSSLWSFAAPVGAVFAVAIVGFGSQMVGSDDAYRGAFIYAGVMILVSAVLLQRVRPDRAGVLQ